MAAPVFAQWYGYSFRDARGQVSRMRVLIGGASTSAVETASQTLKGLLAAASNAHVWLPNQDGPTHTDGAAAVYQNVEDKASLTFLDPAGKVHRFRLPAPIAANFQADGETVNASATAMSALLTNMETVCYGQPTDTAPLVYVAGTRSRVKMIRKVNVFTLDPTETIPDE